MIIFTGFIILAYAVVVAQTLLSIAALPHPIMLQKTMAKVVEVLWLCGLLHAVLGCCILVLFVRG